MNNSSNGTTTLTRRLTETAVLIAIATVLSMIKIDMPMGGGLTLCSMLPIVMICHRNGTAWGLLSAFTYSLLQLVLGLDNVRYGTTSLMVFGIIFFDYILAYTVLGLSAVFDKKVADRRKAIVFGIVLTFFLRFLCHFVTGVWIWDALWPNDFHMASIPYSAAYNGWYMGAETVLTSVAALLLYKPLREFFERQK